MDLEWHEGDMPYSPEFGDYFYSRANGRAECAHVFIGANGLLERFGQAEELTIAETGFGTGLNFAETWRQWKLHAAPGSRLNFTSFEMYPMAAEAIDRALSVWPELDAERRALVAAWPLNLSQGAKIDFGHVTLQIVVGEALASLEAWNGLANVWYLDGFAPSLNPDMWSKDLMAEIARHTKPGGTFATYTAAGWVRRNLMAAGFEVERIAGHAGKRQMCRGRLAD